MLQVKEEPDEIPPEETNVNGYFYNTTNDNTKQDNVNSYQQYHAPEMQQVNLVTMKVEGMNNLIQKYQNEYTFDAMNLCQVVKPEHNPEEDDWEIKSPDMSSAQHFRKGRVLNDQTKQMIRNLHAYFQQEVENGGPLRSLHQVQQRVADALKISRWSVSKALKQEATSSKVKRPRACHKTKNLDSSTKDAIRRVIYEMYFCKKQITLNILAKVLKDKDIFTYSQSSLARALKDMGFDFKKDDNRCFLMEQPEVVSWRVNFLQLYKKLSRELDIVFVGDTSIFSNGSGMKSKQDNVKKTKAPGTRYIILHAGNKNGFIPDVGLCFPSCKNTGDIHSELNAAVFEEWLENKLLLALEQPSLIILDNASYHSRILNPPPTVAWKKTDIQNYLVKLGLSVDENLFKCELVELAKQNSPKTKYVVDELVASHGHRILRLPPYHSHYNAMEMVFSQCKSYYDSKMGLHGYGHAQVVEMWKNALTTVTKDNWNAFMSHTDKIIDFSWNREAMLDSSDCQPLMIHTGADDGSENSESESDGNS